MRWRDRVCAHANSVCSLETAAGTSKHGRAPTEWTVKLAQWSFMGYGPNSTAQRGVRASQARELSFVPRESERSGAQAHDTRKPPREVRVRAGTWEHGLAQQEGRRLARTAPFHSAWSECHQRGAARARVGSARPGPRPKRERAHWRETRYTHNPPQQVRARASTWEHDLAPKEGGFSLVQRPSTAHAPSVVSAARRTRATSARAGPRPKRERAQWRERALHLQPTSASEGQGWHVGALPCTEGGRLFACAALFHGARSDCRPRKATLLRSKVVHPRASPCPHLVR